MNKNRIILSGGGTGGHIYPAISIANELLFRDKNSEILLIIYHCHEINFYLIRQPRIVNI